MRSYSRFSRRSNKMAHPRDHGTRRPATNKPEDNDDYFDGSCRHVTVVVSLNRYFCFGQGTINNYGHAARAQMSPLKQTDL